MIDVDKDAGKATMTCDVNGCPARYTYAHEHEIAGTLTQNLCIRARDAGWSVPRDEGANDMCPAHVAATGGSR